jgi:hypothetical protein
MKESLTSPLLWERLCGGVVGFGGDFGLQNYAGSVFKAHHD